MTVVLTDLEPATNASEASRDAGAETPARPNRGRTAVVSSQQILPQVDSEEYRLFYLPTMLAVYTARHQQMPISEKSLHLHIFGLPGHPGCEACRRETVFLIAHQKRFL